MNERIKELAEQAMQKVCHERTTSGQIERTWDPKLYDQTFAELIVRECVKQIEDEHTDALDNHLEDWDRGYLDGLSVANEVIRKHFDVDYFGVE